MQKKKGKILFLVQLPPPVHGASLMNENLIESSIINDLFETSVINLATADQIGSIGKFSLRKIFRSLYTGIEMVKRIRKFKPDMVYFTLSPSGFAFYRDALYVFLIRLFRFKMVYHLHGSGIRSGMKKSHFSKFLIRSIFKNSYTIHLSPILLKDLEGIETKRKFIVNNGIPMVMVDETGRTGNPVKLLFLSNYVRTKGILDLIDALEIVSASERNFHLNLVGRPYDINEKDLQQYISEKKLDGLVSVVGPKYGSEKFEYLKNSDVMIFPTYYFNEAFPLVLLEAMQFGLPCISTVTGGIPDMIEEGKTGFLVEKRSVTQLAEKILLLLKNSEMISTMGKNARQVYLEKYTLPVFERNMVTAFEEILNDNS